MPHLAHPTQPQQFFEAGIPEICPPGEGTVLKIDKIFWATTAASFRLQCVATPASAAG
jgi:hypothetical protein